MIDYASRINEYMRDPALVACVKKIADSKFTIS